MGVNNQTIIIVVSGIETKSQDQMYKGNEEEPYYVRIFPLGTNNEREVLGNIMLPWLTFTTGTRITNVTGSYLYHMVFEGFHVINNNFNTVWSQLLKGRISDTSKRNCAPVFTTSIFSTAIERIWTRKKHCQRILTSNTRR